MMISLNPPSRTLPHQRVDRELLGADSVQRGDPAQEHVIQPAIGSGLLQGDQVAGLLDHAEDVLDAGSDRGKSSHSFTLCQIIALCGSSWTFSFTAADGVGQFEGILSVDAQNM